MSDTTASKDKWSLRSWVSAFVTVGIGTLLFVSCTSAMTDTDNGDSDPEVQRQGAQIACEDMLRDQLKAPASANFTDTTATGSGPWTVTGQVDAQNSFGASLRSAWSCEVRLDGDMFRGRASLD